MKRFLSIFLSICFLSGLVACSHNSAPSDNTSGNQQQTTTSKTEQTIPDTSEDTTEDSTEEPLLEYNNITPIKETVLYDKGGLKVTAKSLTHSKYEVAADYDAGYIDISLGGDTDSKYYEGPNYVLPHGELSHKYGYMSFIIEVENSTDSQLHYTFEEFLQINGQSFDLVDFFSDHSFTSATNDVLGSTANIYPRETRNINFMLDCLTLMSYGIYEITDIQIIGFEYNEMGAYINDTGYLQVKTSSAESHDYNTNYYNTRMNDFAEAVGIKIIHRYNHIATLAQNGHDLKVHSTTLVELESKNKMQLWMELENIGTFRQTLALDTDDGSFSESRTQNTPTIYPGQKCVVKVEFEKPKTQCDQYSFTLISHKLTIISHPYDNRLFEISVFLSDYAEEHSVTGTLVYKNGTERVFAKCCDIGTRYKFHFWAESNQMLAPELQSSIVKDNGDYVYDIAHSITQHDKGLVLFKKEYAKLWSLVEEIDNNDFNVELSYAVAGNNFTTTIHLKSSVPNLFNFDDGNGVFLEQYRCDFSNCPKMKKNDSKYCRYQTCQEESCNSGTYTGVHCFYCEDHMCAST